MTESVNLTGSASNLKNYNSSLYKICKNFFIRQVETADIENTKIIFISGRMSEQFQNVRNQTLSFVLRFYSPRRISAIFARAEKTDSISFRRAQVSFAPEPGLVNRLLFKLQAEFFELLDFRVQIFAFEIKNYVWIVCGSCVRWVKRKSRVAVRTGKAHVARRGIDD